MGKQTAVDIVKCDHCGRVFTEADNRYYTFNGTIQDFNFSQAKYNSPKVRNVETIVSPVATGYKVDPTPLVYYFCAVRCLTYFIKNKVDQDD